MIIVLWILGIILAIVGVICSAVIVLLLTDSSPQGSNTNDLWRFLHAAIACFGILFIGMSICSVG